MALVDAWHRSLENHSMWDICTEVVLFLGAVWIAFLLGLAVGWGWKPKWVTFSTDKLACRVVKLLDSSLPSSPRWSRMSSSKGLASGPSVADSLVDKNPPSASPSEFGDCSTSELNEEQQSNVVGLVTVEDLEHLYKLVEVKDGGPAWIHMMDRSTPGMSYQAWRRDPKNGPPQYRSRTVFEDASPEIVRDLFWDDEFRKHWDDMLASFNIIDECPTTGTMLVQWIRKFPFFCSDREYIIGRRIWESGRSYYCVTKGASGSSVPRRDKPRRVDLYYSSWFIRAVESRRGDGQLTACEVLLYHHEDMGIPWEIAKLGVRQGMWGTVKKIEPGLRAYQKARASGAPLSRSAFMAQINTKVNLELLRSLGSLGDGSSESESVDASENPPSPNIAKFLIIGGALVLACSIDQGLLTKTFIFGVARRFANIGKRVRVQQLE